MIDQKNLDIGDRPVADRPLRLAISDRPLLPAGPSGGDHEHDRDDDHGQHDLARHRGRAGRPAAAAFKPRPEALAESPRVEIRSDSLLGSIALTGGRLDDLTLAKYRETVQKDSPLVVLLNPPGTKDAYYADFGWFADSGSTLKLPGRQYALDLRRHGAHARPSRHPYLGQRPGPALRPQVRGRPELHVHRHGFGEERRRRAKPSSIPMPASCASARPRPPATTSCMRG